MVREVIKVIAAIGSDSHLTGHEASAALALTAATDAAGVSPEPSAAGPRAVAAQYWHRAGDDAERVLLVQVPRARRVSPCVRSARACRSGWRRP